MIAVTLFAFGAGLSGFIIIDGLAEAAARLPSILAILKETRRGS